MLGEGCGSGLAVLEEGKPGTGQQQPLPFPVGLDPQPPPLLPSVTEMQR